VSAAVAPPPPHPLPYLAENTIDARVRVGWCMPAVWAATVFPDLSAWYSARAQGHVHIVSVQVMYMAPNGSRPCPAHATLPSTGARRQPQSQ
jgi:hypothetical protein